MKFFKRRKRQSKAIDAVAEFEAHETEVASRGRADLQDAARPLAPGAKAFMWLMLAVGCTLMGVLAWRAFSVKKEKDPEALAALRAEIRNVLPSLKLKAPESEPAVPPPPPPPPETAQVPGAPSVPGISLSPGAAAPMVAVLDPVEQRRLASGLQGEQGKSRAEPASGKTTKTADSGPMSDKLQPLQLSVARAGRLANRDMLITQGAMIDCGMDTKLVSAQPGMISCYASREVRSTSGRVVLVDKGSKFTGYQQNVIAQGQPRIGVVWSRLETPEGVIINLDSPGTGSLGEAGLDGYIDTHFAERFGGAILVSLIGDLGTWASNRGSGDRNNNTVRFDSTSNAAKDAVTTVLEHTINIPPTLYRNQGGRVGIYVARDLDFSGVYDLRPVQRAGR